MKQRRHFWQKIRLIPLLSLLLSTALVFGGCDARSIDAALDTADALLSEWERQQTGTSPASTQSAIAAQTDDTIEVHFIDVGQADSAFVRCGEETMLIDGGNVADSSLVVSYLQQQNVETLDYIICTHAHEDHVGGLSGALNAFSVQHVLCSTTDYDSKAFQNFKKYTQEQGLSIEVPQPGDQFSLGDAPVTILGPVEDYGETNNMSIVLRIDFGQTSFLFTGDMESAAERDLVDSGADLSATLLKVGHHGSDTSSSYVFLREVMPRYAVISVGKNNSYGHPGSETLSRLRDVGAEVFRTDESGHVIAVSDGQDISITTEK